MVVCNVLNRMDKQAKKNEKRQEYKVEKSLIRMPGKRSKNKNYAYNADEVQVQKTQRTIPENKQAAKSKLPQEYIEFKDTKYTRKLRTISEY